MRKKDFTVTQQWRGSKFSVCGQCVTSYSEYSETQQRVYHYIQNYFFLWGWETLLSSFAITHDLHPFYNTENGQSKVWTVHNQLFPPGNLKEERNKQKSQKWEQDMRNVSLAKNRGKGRWLFPMDWFCNYVMKSLLSALDYLSSWVIETQQRQAQVHLDQTS